jgi:hypothetical protein
MGFDLTGEEARYSIYLRHPLLLPSDQVALFLNGLLEGIDVTHL